MMLLETLERMGIEWTKVGKSRSILTVDSVTSIGMIKLPVSAVG